MRAILCAASEDKDFRTPSLYRLIAATGMRREEACGLQWSDIDWSASRLTIERAISEVDCEVTPPKTAAGNRTVAIDSGTLEILRDLRRAQERLAKDGGVQLAGDSFVFSSIPGGQDPPRPDSVTKRFAKIRMAAKVPAEVKLHSLRHFASTQLDGVVTERQKMARLGWSSQSMAHHYTHASEEEDRKSANHLGSLLGNG